MRSLSFTVMEILQVSFMTPADYYIQDINCPFKGGGLFFVNVTDFTFSLLRLFAIGCEIFLGDLGA